jgi:hypothetical protein
MTQKDRTFDALGERVVPVAEQPVGFLRYDKDLFVPVATRQIAEIVDVGSGGFLRTPNPDSLARRFLSGRGSFASARRGLGRGAAFGRFALGRGLFCGHGFFRPRFWRFRVGFGRFFHGDTRGWPWQSAGEFRLIRLL